MVAPAPARRVRANLELAAVVVAQGESARVGCSVSRARAHTLVGAESRVAVEFSSLTSELQRSFREAFLEDLCTLPLSSLRSSASVWR